MRRFFALLFVCFASCSSLAKAETVGIERFDYLDGPLTERSGGFYWDWNNELGTHEKVVSSWSAQSGAPQVLAGRLVTNGDGALRMHIGNGDLGFTTESDGAFTDPSSSKQSKHRVIYYKVEVTTEGTLPSSFDISADQDAAIK